MMGDYEPENPAEFHRTAAALRNLARIYHLQFRSFEKGLLIKKIRRFPRDFLATCLG